MKKAFTLTEIILVLVIMGALALILIPHMMNMMPDDHIAKYKKAFYTTQEVISDIISNPDVCPGYDVNNAVDYSEQPLNYCIDSAGNARNLDVLMCDRLSTTGACGAAGNNTDVQTVDNMRWNLPSNALSTGDRNDHAYTLYVNLDGNNPGNVEDADNGTFVITINSNGKVQPGGVEGADLLSANPNER